MRVPGTLRHSCLIVVVLGLAGLLGCSTSRDGGGALNLVNAQGAHPAGFIGTHPGLATSALEQCRSCHGQDLKGGISKASCFTAACHHDPVPGWALPGTHGLRAKRAPDSSGGGFASCQICHGTDFLGGGSAVACGACHTTAAPHPAKPWHTATSNHASTDPANAPVCAQCHFPGSTANPAGHPASPAPAGTAPGCFNNTLCHGNAQAPHALGVVWTDATSLAFHGLEAKKDLGACQTCHGTPGSPKFDGGSASTKCTTCHIPAKAHPTVWNKAAQVVFPGFVSSHRNALKMDTTCNLCHDFTKGRTAPDPTAPSCYSTANNAVTCHFNGPGQPNHAVPFTTALHTGAVQATFDTNCSICHAVSGTSPSRAPLCTTCHQAGSPLTQTNCASCHAKPPTGAAFPNVAGVHAKHDALASVTGACAACHEGSDSGSLTHYNHANARPGYDALRLAPGEVKLGAVYNASPTRIATFNAAPQTCSNVSCHGGATTPGWQAANSILSNQESGCRQCHTPGAALGVPDANSPYSGLHSLHLNSTAGLQCVECHAMANGSTGALNHFKFLNTSPMEGPAGQTVAFSTTTPAAVYDIASQSCGSGGAFSCHGRAHAASYTWTGGGASHAVPYADTAHTSVNTLTAFNSNCAACHDVAAPTTKAGPSCTTCHQAASPLTATNCSSCHSRPPVGTVFPDVAGKHAAHNALTGVTGLCATCHSGSEPGNANLVHYNHANSRTGMDALRVPPGETSFLAAYHAKSGVAAFNTTAYTCSNISCHGGITAPDWRTGTIAINTEAGCRSCHSLGPDPATPGIPEANSAYSGLHGAHLASPISAQCVDCHSMTVATPGALNHFKALATSQMEGPSRDTIVLPAGGIYDAVNQTCTVTCHNGAGAITNHVTFGWTGGANHTVPYANHGDLVQTQAAFDASCKACHAVTGTSPMSLAPLCSTCHTAGSPLTVTNCASCHGKPPTGTAFPNIAGRHAAHNALPELAGACVDCHSGAEPRNANLLHYTHANNRPGRDALRVPPGEVYFPGTLYNAKSGTAAFSTTAQTCSNTSCHGGQTTPAWGSGIIDVNTQCSSCHGSGTTQYNAYNSGEHSRHVVDKGIACIQCHNTVTLAVSHFTGLKTAAMDTAAARQSVGGGTTQVRTYSAPSCTPTTTTGCHGTKTW
ncbi:MAG: CxxxxCH/CxxCH domain-containing protein [Geothrix sp.]|nr:CxxxxCH/CxxCH domain-containing protein [Geothrix sp.]